MKVTNTGSKFRSWFFAGAWLIFVPGLLGAKGCDVGELGYDLACGHGGTSCAEGEFCEFEEAAACGARADGVCKPVPEGCDANYEPVCGCDGETYSNSCEANATGAAVEYAGPCSPEGSSSTTSSGDGDGTTTGSSGGDGDGSTSGGDGDGTTGGSSGSPTECTGNGEDSCKEGDFCSFTPEAQCGTEQAGTCQARPDGCDGYYEPVCGCDGETYSNACEAASEGVSVDHPGDCNGAGECTTDEECGPRSFCEYTIEESCGEGAPVGVCAARPEVCDDEYDPVCGCDGKTYSNSCVAQSAGQSVASLGACGADLGCETDEQCLSAEFCDFAMGSRCGGTGMPGTCTPVPEICTTEVNPVCGCDGVTYSNACEAQAASVSVEYLGACEDASQACGGISGQACPDGTFCRFLPDEMCGAGDQEGICSKVPSDAICDIFSAGPACGCDGKEYMTSCHAWQKEVSVASFGPCD